MVIGWLYTPSGCMAPAQPGDAQGGFQRSALKPLLWREPPAFGGVGGTLPPGFPPEGETGKGEFQIPCCRRQLLPLRVRPASPYRHSKAGIPEKSSFTNQR